MGTVIGNKKEKEARVRQHGALRTMHREQLCPEYES
jgi:hypothetical protein